MDVKQSSELGVIHHYRLRPQDKKKKFIYYPFAISSLEIQELINIKL